MALIKLDKVKKYYGDKLILDINKNESLNTEYFELIKKIKELKN